MPYEPEKIGHVDVYYHALILYAANWTAYVGLMAVLLLTGVMLSVEPNGAAGLRVWGAAVASGVSYGGTLFFTQGIAVYGEMLCEAVVVEYLIRTHRYKHPAVLRVCRLAAVFCLAGNLALVGLLTWGA